MQPLLPTVIVFDLGAILASTPQQWREFTRVGDCHVPASVLHEIEELALRGLDAHQQQIAQQFEGFYLNSDWKLTNLVSRHEALTPAQGHELSKRSRLGLAAAQAAYGLASRYPQKLVVFVSDSQAELRRLTQLQQPNLCCIPIGAMVNWGRSQHKPEAVIHHARAMFEEAERTGIPLIARRPVPEYIPVMAGRKRSSSPWGHWLRGGVANLLGLGLLGLALLGGWRVLSPQSFQQFWRQLPVSQLPGPQRPMAQPAQVGKSTSH